MPKIFPRLGGQSEGGQSLGGSVIGSVKLESQGVSVLLACQT